MFGITIASIVSLVAIAVGVGAAHPSVSYTTLQQGVDIAAQAASAEFKPGYTIPGLFSVAQNALTANGIE